MGSYGRNFDFRQSPLPQNRLGSYYAAEDLLIGSPVKVPDDGELDGNGRWPLVACTGATTPVKGKHGIVVFEWDIVRGYDMMLTRPSDLDTAPSGSPVQLISGAGEVVVVFTNTDAFTHERFQTDGNERSYAGRVMVAGVSVATPTVAAFDYLTPGTGDDTDGYWAEGDADNGWLQVVKINGDAIDAAMRAL